MSLSNSADLNASELTSLRQRLRQRRRAMVGEAARRSAAAVAAQLLQLDIIRRAEHIAGYLTNDGEIALDHAFQQFWGLNKRTYLPIVQGQRLAFAPYGPNTPLRANRFGILEPDLSSEHWLTPPELEVVLTPLVGFDHQGRRLGMGGGFYDRSFAFLQSAPEPLPAPVLLGVAYECQRVEALPLRPWDIPLAMIITDAARYTL